MTAEGLTLALDLPHLELTPPGSASLTIALQGVTQGVAHEVAVRVNGIDAGTLSFSGQDQAVKTFSVPPNGCARASTRSTLVARGPGEDVSVVDTVRLTYPHAYALDEGALQMTAPAGTQVTLRGLADTSLRVVDVSEPQRPRELGPVVEEAGGEMTARVDIPGQGTATLYAFTPANAAAPDAIVPNQPSNWHQRRNAGRSRRHRPPVAAGGRRTPRQPPEARRG